MDRLRDQFFSGSALARDQNRGVGRCDADDASEHFANHRRASDDVFEFVAVLELAREERDFAREATIFERLLNFDEELLLRKRFLDVVERAEPHRFDGAFDRAVRGHHDDFRHRLFFFDRAKDLDAVFLAHAKIGEHEIERARRPARAALIAIGGFFDFVSDAAKHHRERRSHVALIVDDENLRHDQLLGAPALIQPRIRAMSASEKTTVSG